MKTTPLSPLYDLQWQKVSISLRNITNKCGSTHPLFVFTAIIKNARKGIPRFEKDHSLTFFPTSMPLPEKARIQKGQLYDLDLVFPNATRQECLEFSENLKNRIYNFTVEKCSEPTTRNLTILEQELQFAEFEQQICLNFLTPLIIEKPYDKARKWLIHRDAFFNRFLSRIRQLFPEVALSGFQQNWQNIHLLPYYWQPKFNRTHKSSSDKSEEKPSKTQLKGSIGPLYLHGSLHCLAPLLLICSELGSGKKCAFGTGHYQIVPDHSFFDKRLQNFSILQATIGDIEKSSDMADELAQSFLDKRESLHELHQQLLTGTYTQEPASGFYIDKPRSGKRLIATLSVKDYLVHKLLYRLLRIEMDRMFENAAIGFRPGRSREDARKMIREAASEGFQYALESDIESFFDQIDWDILTSKINDALPHADHLTLKLLNMIIRQPLLVHGKTVPRTKGLLQGSPLSPMLANLYLDSFDEEMESRGFRLIRYGDDFLVMTRNDEEAAHALCSIQEILAPLKLNIKEDKTGITSLNKGISFLGLAFDAELGEEFVAAPALGKTLFIQNQYTFIGIDGDAIVVRKDKTLLTRLPIRRIKEIVIFGSNSISSRLIQKCASQRIPLSFCSRGGYYYSTLRPDSKYHFSRATDHGNRHKALTDGENLKIAARIVTAKIHNYLFWFKERWPVETKQLYRAIDLLLADLAKAETLEKVRGYEGAAAKKIFPFVNHLCNDTSFHCRGRKKRKKQDRFNSLLDFAYSLLFYRLNVLLRNQGLNPYLGFLHSHKDNFESLVCDLQEPFRCRIDRFVVKTINRGIIKSDDFICSNKEQLHLTGSAVGKFLEAFEREMGVRLAGDYGTFKQLLVAQVRTLQRWVDHDEQLRFFYTK